MKKIFITLMILVMILSVGISTYAVEEGTKPQIEVTLKKVDTEDNKTIKLILSLGSFTGVKEGAMLEYEAKLNYDNDIFEKVSVQGLNGWTATYSDSTKKIVGDPVVASANTDVTQITLTVKDGIDTNTTATVELGNFLMTDDDENTYSGYKLSQGITLTKASVQASPETTESSTTATTQQAKSAETTTKTEVIPNALPKAGSAATMTIVVIFIIILATGVISGKGYFGYLKDTHKQIRK